MNEEILRENSELNDCIDGLRESYDDLRIQYADTKADAMIVRIKEIV